MVVTVRLHPITRLHAGKWADMKSKKWICEKCAKPCTVNVGDKMSQDAYRELDTINPGFTVEFTKELK